MEDTGDGVVGMVRKLIVEVVEARDLLPKDGAGTCSPYVVVDFNGQRKRTQTLHRSLNPTWNEVLEFDANSVFAVDLGREPLEVDVLHDRRVTPTRRNNCLGRLRLDSLQFVNMGEEALIHFPLQKKSFFSWVRGDIGLKVYYADVPADADKSEEPPQETETAGNAEEPMVASAADDGKVTVQLTPPPAANEDPPNSDNKDTKSPENVLVEATEEFDDIKVTEAQAEAEADLVEPSPPPPPPPADLVEPKPIVRYITTAPQQTKRESTKRTSEGVMERSKFDLVDKMQYLFVRVVRARYLPRGAKPHVRVSLSGLHACTHVARESMFFEWDQTFAFPRRVDSTLSDSSSLEISIWDVPPEEYIPEIGGEHFVGGICFDTSEIPVRDPSDSPLASQWYRLDGGEVWKGDLMLSTWVGTQADESYHKAEICANASARSKIYLSPKLWYLRLTVMGAQDLPTSWDSHVSVKAILGFQAIRTRFASNRNGSPAWGEDLLIVAAEPLGEKRLALTLECRQSNKDPTTVSTVLGSTTIPLSSVERRVDDRQVTSRWLELEKNTVDGGLYYGAGRVQVRVCLDGGYHVTDEQPHAASDYRPSARQLWKQPIGVVELGIIGCKGLLPMKTVKGKGTTDAYVVAKYGPKWARTRTIATSLDPCWNEQYTWPVYDISTVITIAVFDDDAAAATAGSSRPIGRVRILISTLETGRAYRSLQPLLLLVPTGVKRMGEVDLSVRFSRSVSSMDLVHTYSQPMLPAMHHLRQVASHQRAPLVSAAAKIIASHLSRSDPPLEKEVVMYMLEVETAQRYSMRKVRTSWKRILTSITWALDAVRWLSDTSSWKNPTTTLLAHGVFVLLACYPSLIVPAVTLHISAVGVLKYRKRPRPWETTTAIDHVIGGSTLLEDIDEELDPIPSTKGYEVVKARYDRLRAVVGKVQSALGDVAAHGERIQALVTWRDPRATGIFVLVCLLTSLLLFVVPARVVAIGFGLYFLRHPMFRNNRPPPAVNFFRKLPSLSDHLL